MAINSVLLAREKKFLLANVPKKVLPQVHDIVPGISGATVMHLVDNDSFCAIQSVVCETELVAIIDSLKALGATGILIMKFDRIIP